jgi:hypothetical protein
MAAEKKFFLQKKNCHGLLEIFEINLIFLAFRYVIRSGLMRKNLLHTQFQSLIIFTPSMVKKSSTMEGMNILRHCK